MLLFEKFKVKQVPVSVSNNRKVDLSIMCLSVRHFAAYRSEDLHGKQRKMNNIMLILLILKIDVSHVFSVNAILLPNVHSKQRENKQAPAKKCKFSTA